MILELTAEQKAFKQQVERFAREIVAQRAAGIDKSGEFPTDVMHAAAGQGLLGVTIPKAWGGAGRDYVSYALAIEAIAQGERHRRRVAVGHQLARRRGHRARGPRSAARAVAAEAGARRGDRRLRAVGARRRYRRRQSADEGASESGGGYRITGRKSGSPTPRKRRWRSCSRARGPGCAARGSPRFSCRWTRRESRGPRAPTRSASAASAAWISTWTSPSPTTRCSATWTRVSDWRCGRCRAAASRLRRRRWASARRRSTRRSPTRSSESSSVSRSPTIRRFSGCWPTWRPSWPPRGC